MGSEIPFLPVQLALTAWPSQPALALRVLHTCYRHSIIFGNKTKNNLGIVTMAAIFLKFHINMMIVMKVSMQKNRVSLGRWLIVSAKTSVLLFEPFPTLEGLAYTPLHQLKTSLTSLMLSPSFPNPPIRINCFLLNVPVTFII
jgi:hypothetical protein